MTEWKPFDWPNGPPPALEPTAQSDLAREIEKWCSSDIMGGTFTDGRDAEISRLKAELAVAREQLSTLDATRRALLMVKVERDQAVSERNMALRAYVSAIEAQVIEIRDADAKRQAESPGAKALNAITVTQDVHRVR